MLLSCLQACSVPEGGPPVTERDSAGVHIVEAHVPVWSDADGWHLDPEPMLDLAEHEPGDEYRFYRIRGMRWFPDGSLVVANGGSGEIRFFSASGDFTGSIGGRGEGPGEFANMQEIELVGDSVFVLDIRGRVTVFGPGPALVRTMTLHFGVQSVRSLGDGTLVAEVMLSYPEPIAASVIRAPMALLRMDLEGVRLDSIGRSAGFEEYTDNVTFSGSPLFARRSYLDTHDGRIYYGASDFMEVHEMAPGGDLLRILRIPDYPLALTSEQVDAERNERLSPGGMELPPTIRQAVEAMPSPATRPAYSDMLVDPTGAIWLRPFLGSSETGESLEWLVLDMDGVWLGGVEVPEDFRIREIGMDMVLGIWVDELGVQHPQVRRLRRDGAGSDG